MKKILIILLFFSSIVSAETKKKGYIGRVALTFSVMAEMEELPPYVQESDFKLPKPFGIQLGGIFDKDIVIEIDESWREKIRYYVTPPIINESFQSYKVTTLHNKVVNISAEGHVGEKQCEDRLSVFRNVLSSKYGGYKYKGGTWRVEQAKIKEFDLVGRLIVSDFYISLMCAGSKIYIRYEKFPALTIKGLD